MPPRGNSGLTLVELIVIIILLAVLASLSLHNPVPGFTRGQMSQTLSNMKQLHLATQQMALDRTTTGNTNVGWPGDTGGTFSNWTKTLVEENYLTREDLARLLSTPKHKISPAKIPLTNTTSILIYAVREKSPGDTVFLSTANFTNLPTGGKLDSSLNLYAGANTGFLVFRKAGDGAILRPKDAANTNLIGAAAPLLH